MFRQQLPKPGAGREVAARRVAADDDVGAVERLRFVHHRLRGRRHHLLAGRAVDNDAAWRLRPREVLGHRDRRRHADRSLRAVLIAVERALRAAQRVVLEDDAEHRAAVVLLELRDERGREPCGAGFDAEVVLPQIVGQLADGPFLLEADLRMHGDVVSQREELLVHQLLGAGDHLVARRVRSGEARYERWHVERLLERRHRPEHLARGLALGRRVLREERNGSEEEQKKKGARTHRHDGHYSHQP